MTIIEPITAANVSLFKSIRLRALSDSPAAFSGSYARESMLSDADWLNRATNLTSESSIGFLAMDAENACGIAYTSSDELDAAVTWLESMWVAPSHRRSGIGRLLINAIVTWARSQKLRAVKLEVASTNDPAIRFYESLGFVLTGRMTPNANDSKIVECEMVLSLD